MMDFVRRNLYTFWRISATGFRNFFRNAWLTTASTTIMMVTLTIILGAFMINMMLTDTIDSTSDEFSVSIFLLDDASQSRQDELQRMLAQNEYTESVVYRSKDEALKIFQDRNVDEESLLVGLSLTDNVLPASFEVQVTQLDKADDLVSIATSEEFSDVVEDTNINDERRNIIEKAAGAQRFVSMAGIVTAGIFGGISILIIFNTIRMAIFTRSEEIEIMKLIGATPGYIRGPFLFEASMYGVIAGILSFFAIYSAVWTLDARSLSYLELTNTIDFFNENWPVVLIGIICLGILIGLLSSFLAIAKYLRLKHW